MIHFRFRVRLGVAWDCRSAKHVTSPLDFFSITFHPYDSYDVFLVVALWPLDLEFSHTIQMQKCWFVERLRTC